MEKTISVRRTTITFSIWDLGGQREFVNMLPLVCNDAVAILFMFDLSRKSTLNSVKEWYRQARGFNKVCYLNGCQDWRETSSQISLTIFFLRRLYLF
jgi:GTPase SAR1 family protein